MVDFLLDLLDFNEGVDYSIVSKIIVGYLILLWVFVSIWVFNDAKKRFNKVWIALILGLLNLVLSFPFLLIYLLIRPSHKEDWEEFSDEGGINIPIVNFSGEDGVVISLQLKINSDKLSNKETEYKLDVSLNADEDDSEPEVFPVSEKITIESDNTSKQERKGLGLKVRSKKIIHAISIKKTNFVDSIRKISVTEPVIEVSESEEPINESKSSKKKKSKKKNKQKKKKN